MAPALTFAGDARVRLAAAYLDAGPSERDEIDKVARTGNRRGRLRDQPYSLRELLSRIRALLRRAYGELASADGDLLYRAIW